MTKKPTASLLHHTFTQPTEDGGIRYNPDTRCGPLKLKIADSGKD
ncbi:hypothetical protein OK016_04185 [Vibrio chagasii]|nr:hypothetical protein [Vibrio chagasii]